MVCYRNTSRNLITQQVNQMMNRVFLLLIAILCVGCSVNSAQSTQHPSSMKLKQDILDGGFLTETPCAAPCFINIVPGVTDEERALQILFQYFQSQDCDVYDRTSEGGVRGVSCHPLTDADRNLVALDFNKEKIVSGISFTPTQVITVEQTFKKYGEPSGVSVISWTEEGEKPRKIFMALYYNEMKTRITLPIQVSENYKVLPSTPIEAISYVDIPWWSSNEVKPWNHFGEYPLNVP